jgi:hypothetical protein
MLIPEKCSILENVKISEDCSIEECTGLINVNSFGMFIPEDGPLLKNV